MTPIEAELKRHFWEKVAKTESCWLWRGSTSTRGYGRYRGQQAHRVSFELSGNEIPKGLVLDHKCRVRNCVNPDHLRAVTNLENLMAGIGPTATNAAKTHCLNGHPFNEENTYYYKRAGRDMRYCKQCILDRTKKRRASQISKALLKGGE